MFQRECLSKEFFNSRVFLLKQSYSFQYQTQLIKVLAEKNTKICTECSLSCTLSVSWTILIFNWLLDKFDFIQRFQQTLQNVTNFLQITRLTLLVSFKFNNKSASNSFTTVLLSGEKSLNYYFLFHFYYQ